MTTALASSDKVGLLCEVPIFSHLGPDALEEVAAAAVPRRSPAGAVLFWEGDRGDTCYVVRTGVVRATSDSHGRPVTFAEYRRPAIVGELAMFGDAPRSATVRALKETTTLALAARDVRRLLLREPGIAVRLLEELAERIRATSERFARQHGHNVAGRIARALLEAVEAGPPDAMGNGEVTVALTHGEIAETAGCSREAASRFLSTLEGAGVIACGRRKVIVRRPDALEGYIY